MGCFDIYCLLCGNSCHSSNINKEVLLEEIQNYKKNMQILNQLNINRFMLNLIIFVKYIIKIHKLLFKK